MRILRLVLTLWLVFVPVSRMKAQFATASIFRTGDVAYATKKDTLGKIGGYIAGFDGRNFLQLRRGPDGSDVFGVFLGRDLIYDSYHRRMHAFLSGGMLTGNSEKGPAVEFLVTKISQNEGIVGEARSEYGWGTFGTQNFARNSFLGFIVLGENLAVGANADVIYRLRSHVTTYERADFGPVARVMWGPTFLQVGHDWDLLKRTEIGKAKKVSVSFGLSPM